MVEAYQAMRWKAFDGTDFATKAEAQAYEESNFANMIVGLTSVEVELALARDASVLSIADAIEKAGALIAKARREAGDLRRKPRERTVGQEPDADANQRAAAE